MPETWEETRKLAREAFDEALAYQQEPRAETLADDSLIEDLIFETADSTTPVYNADRMTVAAAPDVWSQDVDHGLVEGSDLMQIVGLYIFEAIYGDLHEYVEELRKAEEEAGS